MCAKSVGRTYFIYSTDVVHLKEQKDEKITHRITGI